LADGLAVAIGYRPGEGAEDAARGVRDEDRVVVVVRAALLAHEAQQVRHLLEVGTANCGRSRNRWVLSNCR
jgi:hypothetical protein